MTITTTRTRADRVQQLAAFLAAHPEVDVDLSDTAPTGRAVLNFHPRTAADVRTVRAALTEPGDEWNTSHLSSGFVSLDTGALGYSAVFIHLPREEQPLRLVSPEITELFA